MRECLFKTGPHRTGSRSGADGGLESRQEPPGRRPQERVLNPQVGRGSRGAIAVRFSTTFSTGPRGAR